jgi:predicted small metal-binding protein
MPTRKEYVMSKVVRCACGVELRDGDEKELIRRVQEHAREAHELTLSEEQVRDMMEIDQ